MDVFKQNLDFFPSINFFKFTTSRYRKNRKKEKNQKGHIDIAKCSWNLHKVINKNTGCQKRGNSVDFVKMHVFPPFLAQVYFVFYFI